MTVCMHMYVCECVCVCVCVCECVCMSGCVYMCVNYVCMCVCEYVRMGAFSCFLFYVIFTTSNRITTAAPIDESTVEMTHLRLRSVLYDIYESHHKITSKITSKNHIKKSHQKITSKNRHTQKKIEKEGKNTH